MNEFHLLPRLHRIRGALRPQSYVAQVVLCALLLTMGALFFLWQRYQFVGQGFEVQRLRSERAQLERAIEPLRVEAAWLSRMERLEQLAKASLGLRKPQPNQVILLENDAPVAGSQ